VFQVAQNFDLQSIPAVHAIFRLREILFGLKGTDRPGPRGLVAEMKTLGWGTLTLRPGRELVMGSVTQPWFGEVKFRTVAPEQFASFAEPDFVKIAWTLEAHPLDAALTLFRTQTRVEATDEDARRKFLRYWLKFGIGIRLIRLFANRAVRRTAEQRVHGTSFATKAVEGLWGSLNVALHLGSGPLLHRWRTRWGATAGEIRASLPGDEFIPAPDWTYNHAITINAPRSDVWPWLVQMGQSRGGLYSYEGLENLIGCDIHNVWEIHGEFQPLKVGDTIRLYKNGFGPQVAIINPERALVLGGPPDGNGSGATWAFYLLDGPNGTTRLLERGRGIAGKGIGAKLGFGPYLMDPVGFVMSRKMLRTIKRLAETGGTMHIPAAA
jgi:hypothetical protein